MTSTEIYTVHAELGASQAYRWIACAGSVALIKTIPPGIDGGSPYAQEGTVAHELARMCMMNDPGKFIDPRQFLGLEIKDIEVDEEMVDSVRLYVNTCHEIASEGDNVLYWVEKRFSLNSINPPAPMYGTADFVAYNPDNLLLTVNDLKYGRGVVVEVKDNPQLGYYGLGALLDMEENIPNKPEVERIKIMITQPRVEHHDGLVRYQEMKYFDLLAFAAALLRYAHATLNPKAPRVAGDHCRFCRAAAICPEKVALAVEVARSEFTVVEPISPPEPGSLTIEELSYVLTQLPALEEWIGQCRGYTSDMLKAGKSVPGWKLVAKRATRKWLDEKMLLDWADNCGYGDDDLYQKKLRSPNQLEQTIGKKNVPEDLYHKKSSGTTLAAEHDARPGINAADEFDVPSEDS